MFVIRVRSLFNTVKWCTTRLSPARKTKKADLLQIQMNTFSSVLYSQLYGVTCPKLWRYPIIYESPYHNEE